jgi:hypothetical protein
VNGRKPVLFDRAIQPEWIDFTLANLFEGSDLVQLRRELESLLASLGLDFTTVQKTARQLQRIAGHTSPLSRERLEADYSSLQQLSPDDRHSVRLQLIFDASPFFADCSKAVRALNANGSPCITVSQLYDRVQGVYGHRGTIPRRVRSVLQTLASFDCLHNHHGAWWVVERSWLSMA